jgi:hypothetical protein
MARKQARRPKAQADSDTEAETAAVGHRGRVSPRAVARAAAEAGADRTEPTASEIGYADTGGQSGGMSYVDLLKSVQPRQGPHGITLDDRVDLTGPYGPFDPFSDPAW